MGIVFIDQFLFFLLGNQEYYIDIKNKILEWIEKNFELYETFFSDDEINNIDHKELAKKEFEDMKNDNSWGSFYSFEIACIVFNISIGVYTTTSEENYKKYFIFENQDKSSELMLINYINNNHFNLLYSKSFNLYIICLFENLNDIKNSKSKEIKFEGEKIKF